MPPNDDLTTRIIDFIRSMDALPDTVPAEAKAAIGPETNIVRDLRLDSVAVMEFIMELEIAFDTIIPLDKIADIETIGDLSQVIGAARTQAAH